MRYYVNGVCYTNWIYYDPEVAQFVIFVFIFRARFLVQKWSKMDFFSKILAYIINLELSTESKW
jgi:hypothetical protein